MGTKLGNELTKEEDWKTWWRLGGITPGVILVGEIG